MKKILILAMVVYLIIAPLTYHPDTKLTLYYATLGNEKVWDIYSYLNKNKNAAPDFHYPPLNYWALKAELPLVKLIGGKDIVKWLASNGNQAFSDNRIFLYNLAVKIPILILVLLSGLIINKLMLINGQSKKMARRAVFIWLFNPITLYSAVIMGQNDILAIFPFLWGLIYYYERPWLAFFLFGIAGGVKSYPLLWALMIALAYPRAPIVKKIVLALISLLMYVLPMLPFLKYDYFKESVLYSGLSIRMFESFISIGFNEKILLVPLFLVILTLVGIKNNLTNSFSGLCLMIFSASFLILGLIHFHPQWFIWIMPFAAMYLADKNNWSWYVILIMALVGIIVLFDDVFLYWGLLSPINNGLVNLPTISDMLMFRGVDVKLLSNLCHSVVAGISAYWLWECFVYDKQ